MHNALHALSVTGTVHIWIAACFLPCVLLLSHIQASIVWALCMYCPGCGCKVDLHLSIHTACCPSDAACVNTLRPKKCGKRPATYVTPSWKVGSIITTKICGPVRLVDCMGRVSHNTNNTSASSSSTVLLVPLRALKSNAHSAVLFACAT
jgi:hypothetical protein